MHQDNRNYHYSQTGNSQTQRANSTPQKNNAGNTAPTQGQINRQISPQMQARRTVNATGAAPRNNQNQQRVQQTARHQTYSVQNARTQQVNGIGQTVRVQNRTANNAVQPRRAAHPTVQAPKQPSKVSQVRAWLKKTYTVNKKAVAERELVRLDLVRQKGSIDYAFFILVLILLAFGTVMVYSASYAYSKNTYGDSYYIIFRQIIFVVVGLIGMGVASNLPPEFIRKISVPVFIGCFIVLCIVPIPIPGITIEHGGARRWINVGFTEIQPSEFMKLGLAMMLAWYFDRFYERITPPTQKLERYKYGVFTPLAITGAVCVLVIIEKHLSGTIIMALIAVVLIFASGAPSFWMIPGAAGGAAVFGLAVALLPHAQRRITIWLNPASDPKGGGYQTLQGLYAIGSGGFFGMGLGNSYQKHMYVSQPQNDFIFTIVCEELGFVGAVGVILLFTLLIWRGIVIAMNAPDIYSQLLTMGIIGKIAIQSILNIAVVTNSIPNTGISLPFFSYGGSSLVVLLVEMGIVLSISRFSKQRK